MKLCEFDANVCNASATTGCLSLCVNIAYICVSHCMDVAAHKCRHHCSVNVADIVCKGAADICCCYYVHTTYVLIIECYVAASKCHHRLGIIVAVTVCSAPICCCYCSTCCICVSHCM